MALGSSGGKGATTPWNATTQANTAKVEVVRQDLVLDMLIILIINEWIGVDSRLRIVVSSRKCGGGMKNVLHTTLVSTRVSHFNFGGGMSVLRATDRARRRSKIFDHSW